MEREDTWIHDSMEEILEEETIFKSPVMIHMFSIMQSAQKIEKK